MTVETLVNLLAKLRRTPSLLRVVKKLGFPIDKEEFRHLCVTQSLLVNHVPVDEGKRLTDGVHIIDVNYGDATSRFWVEVAHHRVIKAYSMTINRKGNE